MKLRKEILKFGNKGEKTGWTYIIIERKESEKLIPKRKTSYRVKLKIEDIEGVFELTTLPMGEGEFIIPLKAELLKKMKKQKGDIISFEIGINTKEYELNKDFMEFLQTEKKASEFFHTLTRSHQNYFSKWIDSAKTPITKANRIAESVEALSKKLAYAEMIRAKKTQIFDNQVFTHVSSADETITTEMD